MYLCVYVEMYRLSGELVTCRRGLRIAVGGRVLLIIARRHVALYRRVTLKHYQRINPTPHYLHYNTYQLRFEHARNEFIFRISENLMGAL